MKEAIQLGKVIEGDADRDAVHVAIAPVVADEPLFPGQRVGLVPGSSDRICTTSAHVGIVDPFLTHAVPKGMRVYLWLFPNTITSLRHDWSHPAFIAPTAAPAGPDVTSSVDWITGFAAKLDQSYDDMMLAADRYVLYGDYTRDDSESYKSHWDDFPVFWSHYEIVTGRKVAEKDGCPFTCSC